MDQPLRCNILIRYSRVSFGQALLFLVLFRVEFAKSKQLIKYFLLLFAMLQGLSEGGGMEVGRGKGGGGEGEGRGGGQGLTYENIPAQFLVYLFSRHALFLTFFRADVAPGTNASTIPCFLMAFGNNAARGKT